MGGSKNWRRKANRVLIPPFQILSVVLLSLLVPISFLLLSRLSLSNYKLIITNTAASTEPPAGSYTDAFWSLFSNLLPHTNSTLLYIIISSVCIAALVHGLSGKLECSVLHSRLYVPWILLFVLQASVALGIEGSVFATIDEKMFFATQETCFLTRVLYFLGLHETMLFWFRVVVKPVVDDTIFGAYKEERVAERAALAFSFGTVCWWKLRDDVGGLVAVTEAKQELLIGLEVSDFVNWWLYYVCVAIGMLRVLKALLWVWHGLVFHFQFRNARKGFDSGGSCEFVDEKV